jgi:hypothetical protein
MKGENGCRRSHTKRTKGQMKHMTNTILKSDLDVLRNTPKKLAAIPTKLERDIAAVKSDSRFNETYKAERIRLLREAASQQIESLHQAAQNTEQSLRKKITSSVNQKPASNEATIARELALDRAWRRSERLLDSGEADAMSLIQEAAQSSDLTMLQALREELPSYLRAKGQTSISKLAVDLITKLETPLLPPAQREAREAEIELERGMPQLNSATHFIRGAVNGDRVTIIPAWEWKQTLSVQEGQQ